MVVLAAVSRPTGVAILAILGFLEGIGLLIAAGIFFAASDILSSTFTSTFGSLFGIISGIAGVTFLIAALIVILLSWGLWSGKNWARIIVIIFSILDILGSLGVIIFNAASGIVLLIFYIIIVYYLTRPHVAAYFKHMMMVPPASQPMSK